MGVHHERSGRIPVSYTPLDVYKRQVLGEQVSLENGVWKVHLAANGSAVLCVGETINTRIG